MTPFQLRRLATLSCHGDGSIYINIYFSARHPGTREERLGKKIIVWKAAGIPRVFFLKGHDGVSERVCLLDLGWKSCQISVGAGLF